ncbi:MAG: hypothetical protein Q7R74_00825 [bacterium]|nr:hypothetical protein [bacterium]
MNTLMTTLLRAALALITGLSLVSVPALALARDAASVEGGTSVTTGGTSGGANVSATFITRAKAKGDQEIDRRIENLNDLLTRVQGMRALADADKTAIQAAISNQVSMLIALKGKIDADTDAATLRTDVQSVTSSYRIYALIIPQIRIIAAADRIVTISNQMHQFSGKLQARIGEAQAAGFDMTAALAALADYNAKVADAGAQAQAAVSEIATLSPDNGDQASMTANMNALKDARAKIVAAQKDLRDARKDAETILKDVRGKIHASAAASTSASTGTGQ